ncbi:MAG: HVO_0476 family zinc finger protein [archaeon]|nr:HVO_0476 family zinc finger protein [archaeon]MDA0842482.1 HVO_0476 family zinc finger protein [archaeon]MDA1167993.1 HVO_0476 family zinc finger protein [archaeon]
MDDEFEEEETLDNALHCPNCEDFTAHEFLNEKPRGDGVDLLVKCQDCNHIYTVEFRRPPEVILSFILSDGAQSSHQKINVDKDEEFIVDDVFEHDEKIWRINQIQAKDKSYHKRLQAQEVDTINALRVDMIRLKLTCTVGERSYPDVLFVPYDTPFKAGSIFKHQSREWVIRAIHTGKGRTLKGTVVCQDIKRIYLHEPVDKKELEPKTPRERRQAWKEGRLGYNPNPIRPKPSEDKPNQQRHGRRNKKRRS